MEEIIKKIFVGLGFLVLILVFNLFFSTNIFWLIMFIQMVFVVLFVIRWNKKWLWWVLVFTVLFILLFKLIPSTECGGSSKMSKSSCDCLGVKKIDSTIGIFSSEERCIGKKTGCYFFIYGSSNGRIPIPCK